jgi:hypothetical protein
VSAQAPSGESQSDPAPGRSHLPARAPDGAAGPLSHRSSCCRRRRQAGAERAVAAAVAQPPPPPPPPPPPAPRPRCRPGPWLRARPALRGPRPAPLGPSAAAQAAPPPLRSSPPQSLPRVPMARPVRPPAPRALPPARPRPAGSWGAPGPGRAHRALEAEGRREGWRGRRGQSEGGCRPATGHTASGEMGGTKWRVTWDT